MPALHSPFRQRGFTLVELLVVILVIAILLLLAAPLFDGQSRKAHDSHAKQVLANASRSAKGEWVTHKQQFPADNQLVPALQQSEPQYRFALDGEDYPLVPGVRVAVPDENTAIFTNRSPTGRKFCVVMREGATGVAPRWSDSSTGLDAMCPAGSTSGPSSGDGGAPTTATRIGYLAGDFSSWPASWTFRTVGLDGQGAGTLFTPSSADTFAHVHVSGGHIYFVASTWNPQTNGTVDHLRRVPVGGGAEETLQTLPVPVSSAVVSGSDVYFTGQQGTPDQGIYRLPVAGGSATRLTSRADLIGAVRNGSIYFSRETAQMGTELWTMPTTGGSATKLTTATTLTTMGWMGPMTSDSTDTPADVAPDGTVLLTSNRSGSNQLYTLANGELHQLTFAGGMKMAPRFSPDGGRIAFSESDGFGPPTLKVMDALPGSAATEVAAGADVPVWMP